MKNTLLLLFVLFGSLIASSQTDVNITFDGTTTMEQVQNHKMHLMENGFLFNIIKMTYSKEGTLTSFSFKVVTPGGSIGTASSEFDNRDQKLKIVTTEQGKNLCVGNCQ